MPSKRAKLSHPSPEGARALSDEEVAEDEEVIDAVEEDDKDPDEETGEAEEDDKDPDEEDDKDPDEEAGELIVELEEEEGEEEDAQQEEYGMDEKQDTEAEDADNEEEEEELEEEEEYLEREVIEEGEEAEEEEGEEDVEEEEEGEGGETERGELEEEEVEAEYEEGDEMEEVEHVGDHDVDSRDEDDADVEEDVDEANEAAGDAEEDEDAHDADEDVLDADEDAHDTDGDVHDAVEDVDDADEDNDGESRKQLAMEDDDDDGAGGGDDDGEDDDDDDEHTKQHVIEDCDGDDEEAAEDERRKQLALLMCFSSLQTLMAMELCRDTTPPLDEVCGEDSTSLPGTFLKLILLAVTGLMQEEGRQCWKLQRPGQEWTHIERGVSSTDSATRDAIWRRKYSMSYACFLYLVEELRPFIQSESQMYVRAPIEIERAVAMVLYRFAHGLSAREVAEKYNVGASTVGKYTLIVASALAEANKLYGRYVAIPTGDRIARIISQFQQITNVSNMCGAIDGTHIKLYFKPDKWPDPSAYQSPQKPHSILLQAVCDANKLFWDVCCMAPGGAHEAAHFITSNLYQNIKEGLSLQEPLLALENKEVTPFMVGDSVYPIRPFLIKPFDTDDALRRAFDEQLRKGSACIDGAFTILKTRWKILKGMNVHLMHAPRIAVACCVLHNICQLWGEPEPPQQQIEAHSNERTLRLAAAYEIDEAAKIAGEAAREALFRDWVKRSLENPCVSLDQENMFSGQN